MTTKLPADLVETYVEVNIVAADEFVGCKLKWLVVRHPAKVTVSEAAAVVVNEATNGPFCTTLVMVRRDPLGDDMFSVTL